MATIRKRNGKWHVQVRRAGHPTPTKTFLSKPDAQKWGRLLEAELDKAVLSYDPKQLEQITVADLLTRYRDTITPEKRGAASRDPRMLFRDTHLRAEDLVSKLRILHAEGGEQQMNDFLPLPKPVRDLIKLSMHTVSPGLFISMQGD